jgi:hypothetical protein
MPGVGVRVEMLLRPIGLGVFVIALLRVVVFYV